LNFNFIAYFKLLFNQEIYKKDKKPSNKVNLITNGDFKINYEDNIFLFTDIKYNNRTIQIKQ
jgi:hypothetical protein